jgi:acyl carrier protein
MDPDLELRRIFSQRERALARVRAILIDDLHVRREPDEIDPDTPLFGTGLGLDSVDAVELLVSLESAFGMKLPEGGIDRRVMRTVNTVVDIVLPFVSLDADGPRAGG